MICQIRKVEIAGNQECGIGMEATVAQLRLRTIKYIYAFNQ